MQSVRSTRNRHRCACLIAAACWIACGDRGNPTAGSSPVAIPSTASATRETVASEPITKANVFYFGHSLVGHDLPQMLGSFARARGKGYDVHGQVGWGTPLMAHWRWQGAWDDAFVPIGFPELKGSLLFERDGHRALATGRYGTVVFTETNGFVEGSPGDWKTDCNHDDIFGGCTVEYLSKLTKEARSHNPRVRAFLYTNWKDFEELGGIDPWLADIRAHVGWWEHVADLADRSLADASRGPAIVIVPTAIVLARIVQQARDGQLAKYGLRDHTPLFVDHVHLTRLGFYLVALTHYAAIFRDTPIGLPHVVDVASEDHRSRVERGFSVDPRLAAYMQYVVWEILRSYPRAGLHNPSPSTP